MSLAAGTRVGAYEILSAIGAGGMGEVYRARDMRLKRDVALKILPESVATDPDRLVSLRSNIPSVNAARRSSRSRHPIRADAHASADSRG